MALVSIRALLRFWLDFEEAKYFMYRILFDFEINIFLCDTGKPELTNGLPEAEAVSELAAGLK